MSLVAAVLSSTRRRRHGSATAGVFVYQACNIDAGLTSPAFGGFSNRGMNNKGACNLAGQGQRGLITGNVVRSGRVKKGAQARYVLNAPPGTRFLYLDWSGQARRRDCRYALQYYSLRPDGPAAPIRNWRANRRCSRKERTQVATVGVPRPKRFTRIAGATQMVQRAVCLGKPGKPFCSARAFNGLTTWIARYGVLDLSAPSAGIVADNPFTKGAWVRGDQSRHLQRPRQPRRQERRSTAGRRRKTEARSTVQRHSARCRALTARAGSPSTRAICQKALRSCGCRRSTGPTIPALSRPLAVRIDNTAPAGVPVTVDGGEAWRSTNSYALSWVEPERGRPGSDRRGALEHLPPRRLQLCARRAGRGRNRPPGGP